MPSLLIIDDEIVLAKNLAKLFERQGHTVAVAHDGQSGIEQASRLTPDLVIVDFQLPDMNGLEVIHALRRFDSQISAVMISGHASVAIAVDAMKAGYIDLLTKPVSLEHLSQIVNKALTELTNRRALAFFQGRVASEAGLSQLLGDSAAMQALRQRIATIASHEPTDNSPPPPVLITGETGTGKELVAKACHFAGPRADKPFVDINCAALPAHLIEAELFGFEKGAFTDAKARKIGLIEAAHGGTLFLDEIGEMDLTLQAKLLRVLEGFKVRRLGALQDTSVNVRVVAATNRSLQASVDRGTFRADLLYRLGVLNIESPALRDRGNDAVILAASFATQFANRYGKPAPVLSEASRSALLGYHWPGNVRELRNIMERVLLLNHQTVIEPADLNLPAAVQANTHHQSLNRGSADKETSVSSLEDVERTCLLQALEQTGWNVTQSARLLGISRDTLRYRIEKHQLNRSNQYLSGS